MPERAVPPPDIAPHDFFTRWVPSVVRDDESRRRRLGDTQAVLEFHLVDDEGSGEGGIYALHIEEGEVRGQPGEVTAADLRIRLELSTWRALNEGRLSAPEAFLRRRIRLTGDLRLAVKLHVIIG